MVFAIEINSVFLFILAGLPRLCAALVNHAGLYPETAESLIAESGLHTQKPWCSTTAITAVSTTTAAVHPQRWVYMSRYLPREDKKEVAYTQTHNLYNFLLEKLEAIRISVMFLSYFLINHVQLDLVASKCTWSPCMVLAVCLDLLGSFQNLK